MPKPLTIGVDVRDLRVSKTGLKTYLEELCHEFKNLQSDDLKFRFLDTAIPVPKGNSAFFRYLEHVRYQLWKQAALPIKAWAKKCDVVLCTDNFVPLIHLGFKTVPVFHDAFFFETPENYGKLWLKLYKTTALPAAKKSLFIITPTDYAKKQIHQYTRIPLKKLVRVYEGPKTVKPNVGPETDILFKHSLRSKKYILHVGSMYKRKNIPLLIDAFIKLKRIGYSDLQLVLAGSLVTNQFDNDADAIKNAIETSGFKTDIIITGYLSDNEIGQLYQNAIMYVFPSLNEGFGLPVLEAFAHRTPVIVANNTCLPEVGGNAVLQFDPYSIEDLYGQIKRIIDDPALSAAMVKKGEERLKQFSWRKTAFEILEAIRKAI